MTTRAYETAAGRPHPLGATPDAHGVNFSVFSRNATAVELLLFDQHDDRQPAQTIPLDPAANKTFFFWHVYVQRAAAGGPLRLPGRRPGGPARPGIPLQSQQGADRPLRLRQHRRPLEPGRRLRPNDNLATSMRSVVIDMADYDWQGDRPLDRPMNELVIYEMHVGGFTRHASSGVKHPGTFAGDRREDPVSEGVGDQRRRVAAGDGIRLQGDAADEARRQRAADQLLGLQHDQLLRPGIELLRLARAEGAHVREFRDLVKALHRAGIAVILDTVFNHTSEGNHLGPTINFKGFCNEIYYHLVPSDRQYYMDYSGCGNTVNCNHPVVQKFILECLEFWVREMHVDGFRFDEGSILSRGEDGVPMAHPPVIWSIELSESLLDAKIIAEAWDAAGLYQIGYFPGYRWAEWNGRFRDDVRRFVRGDPGLVGAVASRISGSADIYQTSGHLPINSINFVTCHDGFTLNDLVSYNGKHNEANGEDNRDGINDNLSWNCGVEGETADPAVEALRSRQVRNFAAILLLSQGVPMILSGDEVRRTQKGNNNAYCQNNELSWIDWGLLKEHGALFRFWKLMIDLRGRHPALHRPRFFDGKLNERGLPDVSWHGCQLLRPGWDDTNARALAFTLAGCGAEADLHVMLNMDAEGLDFELPIVKGRRWFLTVDTAAASPQDIAEPGQEKPLSRDRLHVQGRSVVVLLSR